MAVNSGPLEKWRNYFRTANSDIFDIIEHAIMVAASDCPKEFRTRRDRIAEKLFSCKLARCLGCDQVELAVPADDEDEERCKSGFDREACEFEAGGSKGSKVNSSGDDRAEINMNRVSNYSYGDAEALTDEMEEVGQTVGEVLRIKEILANFEDESDSLIYDSLRRLQLMDLSVETLKATEIGKTVNAVRKHVSKEIRHLARILIDDWKIMVDEWVRATAAIAAVGAEATPESVNPSVVDEEEGLPSPPLDEGAFFCTQPTEMELGQFFDGMDDDGNPKNCGGFSKNREKSRRPSLENQSDPKQKPQLPNESRLPSKEKKGEPMKKQEAVLKMQTPVVKPNNKPSSADSGFGRPSKPSVQQKGSDVTKLPQKPERATIQKTPLASQKDKKKCPDEAAAVQVKLEATKRKLQERYQQAENAKRQRTIQVMELHDLPKQGLGHRNLHVKPGNHNRQWANGRR